MKHAMMLELTEYDPACFVILLPSTDVAIANMRVVESYSTLQ